MATKQGIFAEKLSEYLKADKIEKGVILDSVCVVSGMTRKGVIKRFRRMQLSHPHNTDRRGRPVYYTRDVVSALAEVWEIGGSVCGENLHGQIGEFIDIEIAKNRWTYRDDTTAKLRAMSMTSVRRHVHAFRVRDGTCRGKSTTRPSTVMSMVPIRMDGWDTAETGVTQVDTVAHCGDSTVGDFVYTVNGTDVATLWGTRQAQWQKGQEVTVRSLTSMRSGSPFPWTEIHPDSGSEFINAHCLKYAADTDLRMTRSRPYHKNDNCYVEERNGHIVRTYIGYTRLDTVQIVEALNELYAVLTLYLNHFVASKRVVSKERIGARWKVTREKCALAPYRRVLIRTDVLDADKQKLQTSHAQLDPKLMRLEIDRLVKNVHDIQRQYGIKR